MKKLVAIILAAVFAFSLAACGSSAPAETTAAPAETTAAPAETTAAPAETTAAPAETEKQDETEAPESEEATEAIEYEEVQLVFTTINDEASNLAKLDKFFMDYVTEHTNGAVTWDVYWSGQMAQVREELDMVSSGSADIAALNVSPFASQIPLGSWPRYTCDGYQGTADYGKHIVFENQETSDLIFRNFEENNVHPLGFVLIGNDGYMSKGEATKIEDLNSKLFGTGLAGVLESDYGLNPVFVIGPDCYDNLSRAVVDCVGLSMIDADQFSLAEVAKYWIFYNRVGLNKFYSINLDKWNSFSPELQQVFEEAGQALIDYSAEFFEEIEGELVKKAESEGVTVTFVDDPEYAEKDFLINAQNALETAKNNNRLDDMKVIIKAAGEYRGIDVADVLAKY